VYWYVVRKPLDLLGSSSSKPCMVMEMEIIFVFVLFLLHWQAAELERMSSVIIR